MQTWPLVAKVATTSRSHRVVAEVGVRQQDRRVVAAELQQRGGQRPPGARRDRRARRRAAGEGDAMHPAVRDQGGGRLGVATHHLEQPVREGGGDAGQQLPDPEGRQRRGLHHDRVARDQGGRDLEHGEHQRRVPRRDRGDDAVRTVPHGQPAPLLVGLPVGEQRLPAVRVVAEQRGREAGLAPAVGQHLAGLARGQLGDPVESRPQVVDGPAQRGGPVRDRDPRPVGLRLRGPRDGARDLLRPVRFERADQLVGAGGVVAVGRHGAGARSRRESIIEVRRR